MKIHIEFDDNFGNEHSCEPIARFWTSDGRDMAVVMLPDNRGQAQPRLVELEAFSVEGDVEVHTGTLQ